MDVMTHRELMAPLLASEFVRYVAKCRSTRAQEGFSLTSSEIELLERHGNTAENWDAVRKANKHPITNAVRIRDCTFHGRVVLGQFDDSLVLIDGVPFRTGCYRSTISNATVLDHALVQDTTLLQNVLVDEHAVVLGCGSVLCAGETAFGNGQTLHVGVEIGGRDLRVIADMPFQLAAAVAGDRRNRALQQAYHDLVNAYESQIKTEFSIISPHARVIRCARLVDAFVGAHAVLEDSDVANTTMLSTQEEPCVIQGKSMVKDSLLQWNSIVETQSFLESAFLCDCSHVERHGIVMSVVLGPNTSIAEGEVTSSLVGPFVGFHHQALLIASFWPQGKGNVGYGANVGSNHTLKAPDQELFPGEGMFFGLGCNIKFPSNFVQAPYSVVATAVSTLPQKVTMPFALINTPGHVIPSLSPAINEISPGWVLAHSVFTVLRNEHKFRTRNKSTRTTIDSAIFRPEIIQYMKDARSELLRAAGSAKLRLPNGEALYTDKQVTGLGKNYMREEARVEAIDAYTFFIKLFALEALLPCVERGQITPDATIGSSLNCSTYELATLAEEYAASTCILECLKDLVIKKEAVARNAERGKGRDDNRGERIIPDYDQVHKPPAEELVIIQAQRSAIRTKQRVAGFVARF